MTLARLPETSQGRFALAQQIESELGVSELTRKLLDYPAMIRHQKDAVQAGKQAVQEAQNQVQVLESIMAAEISTAIDPRTGKAQFSNDTLRKAELTKRQTNSPEYQAALQQLRDAEMALSAAQFELDRLYDEFSAHKAAGNMVAGRLHLMAGLS